MRQERRQPVITNPIYQKRSRRPKNARVGLYDFPPAEVQQIFYIISRQPILQERRPFKARLLCPGQNRAPKVAEEVEH